MATIVPASPYWANAAEKRVAESISKMFPANAILYVHRYVEGKETDLLLFVPEKGFVVIEIKDWRSEKLKVVDGNKLFYSTAQGELVLSSPIPQVNGYRFALINLLKKKGISVAVVPVIFFPSITKEDYFRVRLDLVSPVELSACREELEQSSLFNGFIQRIFSISFSHVRALSSEEVRRVRLLFETEEQIQASIEKIANDPAVDSRSVFASPVERKNDYSVVCFTNDEANVQGLVDGWIAGCKTILVSESDTVLKCASRQLDMLLKKRGLEGRNAFELVCSDSGEYSTFLFSSFKAPAGSLHELSIHNGENEVLKNHKCFLEIIGKETNFNLEQYLVEHAPLDRDIVVRAGAGTGKTHSMISRVAFLLYAHQWNAELLIKSLIMLTFANNAAETMSRRMREYFQNCFLLTCDPIYMELLERLANMQISTIHSWAKSLLAKFSSKIGLGKKLSIVSYQYEARRLIEDCVNEYLQSSDIPALGIDMYLLIDRLGKIAERILARNIDILSDNADFGNTEKQVLGELVKTVLPEAGKRIREDLAEKNKIRVSDLMVNLKQLITNDAVPFLQEGIRYIFVDEFQDTDDIQIELLNQIKKACNCSLFVVGDVKQCIYRFRGAQEQAFERLIGQANWEEFSLRKNYRTDKSLLQEFESIFSRWGRENNKLIPYVDKRDSLIGVKNYHNLQKPQMKAISVNSNEDAKQKLQALLEEHKEGTLAILVRENWEVRQIRGYAQEKGIYIHADVGGGLFQSESALDFYRLVLALQHPNEPKYLFNLFQTSYFDGSLPLLDILNKEKDTNALLQLFHKTAGSKWCHWKKELESEPVLKVLRSVIKELAPWKNYAKAIEDEKCKSAEETSYKNNLEQLYEYLFDISDTEYLTISRLAHFLRIMITTGQSQEIRAPRFRDEESECAICCRTVHKVKGLEYDSVLLFNTMNSLDGKINKGDVDVVVVEDRVKGLYKIGYRMNTEGKNVSYPHSSLCNDFYNEEKENEKSARQQEEARILYVALTRAKKQLLYFEYAEESKNKLTWQKLLKGESVDDN